MKLGLRNKVKACATFALVVSVSAAPSVFAQTAIAESEPVSTRELACPGASVSVYFSEGETQVSAETETLIGRVGEAAASCKIDNVDLVAWVDVSEGHEAFSLALDRLKTVAQTLVERGLGADQMRIAARVRETPSQSGPSARNVKIIMHHADEATPESKPANAPMAPPVAKLRKI